MIFGGGGLRLPLGEGRRSESGEPGTFAGDSSRKGWSSFGVFPLPSFGVTPSSALGEGIIGEEVNDEGLSLRLGLGLEPSLRRFVLPNFFEIQLLAFPPIVRCFGSSSMPKPSPRRRSAFCTEPV